MPYYFETAYNKYRMSVFDTPSHYADCQDQINSFAEDIMNWMEINWGIDYVDPLNNDYKKASSNIEYYESHVPNKHDNSRLGQWLFQFMDAAGIYNEDSPFYENFKDNNIYEVITEIRDNSIVEQLFLYLEVEDQLKFMKEIDILDDIFDGTTDESYVPHRTILNYYENIVNNIVNEGGSFITTSERSEGCERSESCETNDPNDINNSSDNISDDSSDSEVEPSDTENDENIEEQYFEGLLSDDISVEIDENNAVGEENEAGIGRGIQLECTICEMQDNFINAQDAIEDDWQQDIFNEEWICKNCNHGLSVEDEEEGESEQGESEEDETEETVTITCRYCDHCDEFSDVQEALDNEWTRDDATAGFDAQWTCDYCNRSDYEECEEDDVENQVEEEGHELEDEGHELEDEGHVSEEQVEEEVLNYLLAHPNITYHRGSQNEIIVNV